LAISQAASTHAPLARLPATVCPAATDIVVQSTTAGLGELDP
jgi:hypothetical protein